MTTERNGIRVNVHVARILYLEDIDTLPRDVAQKVVFLVEMAAEHLGRLIHRMLNLDGYAPTCLRFLDNLG